MSRKKYKCGCKQKECCKPMCTSSYGCGGGNFRFTDLIILILIVLQFGRKKYNCDGDNEYDDENGGDDGEAGYGFQLVDNGVLFIIAIFFLACGCGFGFGRRTCC